METEYKILNQITPEYANPYSIPIGYFEGLANEVLFKIKTKQASYTVPQDYFTDLSTSILAKVKQQENDELNELENIAPLLNSIKKVNIYNTPKGYFENFEVSVVSESKVITINKRPIKWMKYAVAAAIFGVISITGLNLYHSQTIPEMDVQASIEKVSDIDLKNELNNDKFSISSVDESAVIAPWQNLADLQEEIKYIPDNEIEVYLSDNNIIDESMNSSNS